MNNQITIIDNQNQTMNVDCICYFSNNKNNKKYIFYTKNEIVQDGLIKMYVAEENNGIVNDITPEEWTDLKLIMQDVIKGVGNSIINLPVAGAIKLGGEKVIALNQINIDAIKKSYSNDPKVLAAQNTVSNKDLLSQSFGGTQTAPELEKKVEVQSNQNSMPNVSTDLENSVVNMSTTPSVSSENNDLSAINTVNIPHVSIPEIPSIPNINIPVENKNVQNNVVDNNVLNVPEVPSMPNMNNTIENQNVQNNITPNMVEQNPVVTVENNTIQNPHESEFNVGNGKNLFDMPVIEDNFTVSSGNSSVPEVSDTMIENIPNTTNDLFVMPTIPTVNELKEQPVHAPNVEDTKVSVEETASLDNDLNDEILKTMITIEKNNYVLYMGLAENSKKMIEVLEKQMSLKNKETTNLENTASDLFNSNGALDENKVLGMSKAA